MGSLTNFDVVESGITAAMAAMDVVTQNLVNQEVAGYKAKIPVMEAQTFEKELGEVYHAWGKRGKRRKNRIARKGQKVQVDGGVVLGKVSKDSTPTEKVYDPDNPLADAEGYVEGSNVNQTKEIINMAVIKGWLGKLASLFSLAEKQVETTLSIANGGKG